MVGCLYGIRSFKYLFPAQKRLPTQSLRVHTTQGDFKDVLERQQFIFVESAGSYVFINGAISS